MGDRPGRKARMQACDEHFVPWINIYCTVPLKNPSKDAPESQVNFLYP
jgi:hypothetical protein